MQKKFCSAKMMTMQSFGNKQKDFFGIFLKLLCDHNLKVTTSINLFLVMNNTCKYVQKTFTL